MKVYTKPDFTIYHFDVKDHVADCGDPIYTAVDIPCLINTGSSDGVFYSGTGTACTNYATTSNTITLNGKAYFYWYGPDGGMPSASGTNSDGYMIGTTLLDALKNAGLSQKSGDYVLHAGAASPISSILDAST